MASPYDHIEDHKIKINFIDTYYVCIGSKNMNFTEQLTVLFFI